MNIKKAVIINHAMYPIIDQPVLKYLLEEMVNSGIEEVLVVAKGSVDTIVQYMDGMDNQEAAKLMIYLNRQRENASINEMLLSTRNFVKDESFALVFGNHLFQIDESPALEQLIETYMFTKHSVIGVTGVKELDDSVCAVVDGLIEEDDLYFVKNTFISESVGVSDFSLVHAGRYILRSDIFNYISYCKPIAESEAIKDTGTEGYGGFVNCLNQMAQDQRVYAQWLEHKQYKLGNASSYVKSIIDMSLSRSDLREEIISYIGEKQLAFAKQ